MRKREYLIASLAMLLLLVLSGCKGNKLPDGMDEDKVTSADAIEEMMDTATEGRGSFKKVKDSMVTGVTDADEPHAIAVIGAKYDKKSVVFRIAFDTEMNLIGLDVRGK